MNMTTIREKSKIFLWICLIGFILSLVGVMGTANGGGFLGGASLTSMFSNNVNSDLYVGKVNDKNISRRAFSIELQNQRNSQNQFQFSTSEQYYIGRAWEALIQNTITKNKIEELNLGTQDEELKSYLLNTPPKPLQDFLVQNNIFKTEDNIFDLASYQNAINKNISWVPDSLINVFTNYEFRLKTNEIPRSKLQHLYSMLSTVTDNKVYEEYNQSNSKCNLDILSIDYKKIPDELIEINDNELRNYYEKHLEEKFSTPETVIVDYILFKNITNDDDSLEVLLNEEIREKADDFAFNAREDMLGFEAALEVDSLSTTGTLELTEKFDNNSGLPISMGYNRSIIRFAFDNRVNTVSDKINTKEGLAVFKISDKKAASFKSYEDSRAEISKIISEELKKDYIIKLINEENLSWSEIEKSLNPSLPIIANNPFEGETDKIKEFQTNNGLESDGKWGPVSQKKYEETELEKYNKTKLANVFKSEEASINESFKSIGKNYQLMGYLSVMKDGDVSNIIESNNKIYQIKLNNISEPSEMIDEEKFKSIRKKLLNSMSNSIFNNWIQYCRKNADIIDVRHKSI